MKRVLLTGASGFIGRHAIQGLLQRGYEIHAISRQPVFLPENMHWHPTDICNAGQVKLLMEQINPSHLLHFAWYVDPASYLTSLENFHYVKASLELVELFQQHGGKRVVMAGTCAEYDWRYGYLSEATTPCTSASNYGLCKYSLSVLLQAFCATTGLSGAWGRIFHLFGPYEYETRMIPKTIHALLRGYPIRCINGDQVRDYQYVEDTADAFCALLDSPVTGIVNIGSGSPVKQSELVRVIADIVGKPELLSIESSAGSENETSFVCANHKRLCSEVGWSPSYSLTQGLEKTILWWKNQQNKEDLL